MTKVVCVRFSDTGKTYYFDPKGRDIKNGDEIIVESANGLEFGKASCGVKEVEDDEVVSPLKPVIRIANDNDREKVNENKRIQRLNSFVRKLNESEFRKELNDIISFGLHRYNDKYNQIKNQGVPFVLYEQYSRRDVCFLMNCEKDLSSVMYGMKRIEDDVFIFVTYHKKQTKDISKKYVDGKPDYEDIFESNQIFSWDTQLGKGVNSSYSKNVITAPRKHLMIQKRDK